MIGFPCGAVNQPPRVQSTQRHKEYNYQPHESGNPAVGTGVVWHAEPANQIDEYARASAEREEDEGNAHHDRVDAKIGADASADSGNNLLA